MEVRHGKSRGARAAARGGICLRRGDQPCAGRLPRGGLEGDRRPARRRLPHRLRAQPRLPPARARPQRRARPRGAGRLPVERARAGRDGLDQQRPQARVHRAARHGHHHRKADRRPGTAGAAVCLAARRRLPVRPPAPECRAGAASAPDAHDGGGCPAGDFRPASSPR